MAERKLADDMVVMSDDVKDMLVNKLLEGLLKRGGGWKKGAGETWGFSVLIWIRGLGF